MEKIEIGFLGLGNMASAIVEGMSKSPNFDHFILSGFDQHSNKFEQLNTPQEIIRKDDSLETFLKNNKVIFLGIKPQSLTKFAKDCVDNPKYTTLWTDKVIISMLGATNLEQLTKTFHHANIIRIMPNVNAAIGQATSAICASNQELISKYETVLNSFGDTYLIAEKDFELFAAIAGSAPAIVYLFIDAIANSAVKQGMKKALATKIVASMVEASGAYVQEKLAPNQNARNLVDVVASPGGTTIKGILSLEKNKFAGSLNQAIEAMLAKDKN